MKHLIPLTLLLTIYISCGGYNDDDSDYNPPQEEQTQEGNFRGVLDPMNPDINSVSSAIQMRVENDTFDVEIFGSGPNAVHQQYLREGTRCPQPTDDRNGDGVIDALEGEAIYGAKILPLDSDLETNSGDFPTGEQYRYQESASLTQILNNLGIQTLTVEGRVVTIQGIPEGVTLPSTAQGVKADIPTACGRMIEVEQ